MSVEVNNNNKTRVRYNNNNEIEYKLDSARLGLETCRRRAEELVIVEFRTSLFSYIAAAAVPFLLLLLLWCSNRLLCLTHFESFRLTRFDF